MGICDGILGEQMQVFINNIIVVCLATHILEATERHGNPLVIAREALIMPDHQAMIAPGACWKEPLMDARSITCVAKCRIVGPTDSDALRCLIMPFGRI